MDLLACEDKIAMIKEIVPEFNHSPNVVPKEDYFKENKMTAQEPDLFNQDLAVKE